MLKRYSSIVAVTLLVTAIFALLPAPGSLRAQNRHAYLEEFTGSWCGFCVRGSYCIETLKQKYPNGQVGIVSIHNGDPMSNAQGDSLTQAVGYPAGQAVPGFPDSWATRSVISPATSWNIDPSQWGTGVTTLFGLNPSQYPDGIVDAINAQTATVTCKVDNVSFDMNTHMVTARVTATFVNAMTGDFRLNLMVTEDSVSGPAGTTWDQHNYYSSTNSSVGANLPNNPFYNSPGSISNWQYMDVFREAVGGIYGQKGVIPASVTAGATYSYTFTFPLPTVVVNPNHVHLVGIVHQFSATDKTKNTVYDEQEVKLSSTTIPVIANQVDVVPSSGNYISAHANGDSSTTLNIQNNGSSAVDVNLSVDASASLPAGWSVKFTPAKLTALAAGSSANVTMTVTAPQQSAFVAIPVTINPAKDGFYIPGSTVTINALSDNTVCGLYTETGSVETAVALGIPDSLKVHTAVIPLTSDLVGNFPPENLAVDIYDNIPILDNGGVYSNPTVVQNIQNALDNGKKVFINSDFALYYAFDPNGTANGTGTQDVLNLFARLGIDWTRSTNRYTISGNQAFPKSYNIDGTSDPVSTGISVTNAGGYPIHTGIYVIDSNSIALYYSDKNTKYIVGSRYEDATTHGRLVFLGFDLSGITVQSKADTIAGRAINWLLSASGPVSIAANPTSLDFGTVKLGGSKMLPITITNTSSASLAVNAITVNPPTANFTLGGFALPTTLAAGGTMTVNVTFNATTPGQQTASIEIGSSTEGNIKVPVQATASSSGVSDGGNAPVLGITASPNPFHGMTTVQYVAANGETNVTFAAYDLLGREIAQLSTQNAGGNTYTASFDASKLAEGTYVIIAHSSKGSHEVRVVNQ